VYKTQKTNDIYSNIGQSKLAKFEEPCGILSNDIAFHSRWL